MKQFGRERGCRGLTVLELLLVVAVLAILAAVIIPSAGIINARANAAKCLSNLRQIGIGLQLYLQDHDMQMPDLEAGRRSRDEDVPVIDTVLAEYLDDASVFICPADPKIGLASGTSYFWNPALNLQRVGTLNFLMLEDALSRIPVMSDKEGWHLYRDNRVNFLYADGHASQDLELFAE